MLKELENCKGKRKLSLLDVAKNCTKKLVQPYSDNLDTYKCEHCEYYHFKGSGKHSKVKG
jgi:hypothetical protein